MTGDSKYKIYPNHEEYIKDYFGGLYVPPLKKCLNDKKHNGLLKLAERCTSDTAPLIQGYHFNSELSMRCFIRAILYDIYDNIIKPPPFVNCCRLLEEYFDSNSLIEKYTYSPVLLIIYGKYERIHSYKFDLTNEICEIRKQEDKRTFILSLKTEKEICEQQEQQNLVNTRYQKEPKTIKEFCVPIITIDEVSIHDLIVITRLWEGDSILQPEILEGVDFLIFEDDIRK